MTRKQAIAVAISRLDQQWAELREIALAHDPAVLGDLYHKLDSEEPLDDLEGYEQAFVAVLAKMAIKQIFALCSVDPEQPDPMERKDR